MPGVSALEEKKAILKVESAFMAEKASGTLPVLDVVKQVGAGVASALPLVW